MKKEFILPITLVACSIILGFSYIVVQVQKQDFIERQQERKIEEQIRQEVKEREEQEQTMMSYNWCVQGEEDKYWDYMELNKTSKNEEGAIFAPVWVWDEAEKRKQQGIENCRIQYLK